MLAILSLLPIISVGILLVALRWPASRAMPICYLVAAGLATFVWRVSSWQIAAATVRGLIVAVELLYIVFGAVLLLNTLEQSGGLDKIRQTFRNVTADRRIQVIIVAWLFGSFVEGSAGFGTPAAVAGPLLVGLGFPAMAAAMAGMIIQSTPVSFGAVGTPILVGVSGGLSSDPAVLEFSRAAGYADWPAFLATIGWRVALLHAVAGTLIPLFLVSFMTRFFGTNRSFAEGLAVWRFALFAALAMTIPYLLVAYCLGPEFPSLLGGLIGLALVVPAAKRGFLMPRSEDAWEFEQRELWPAEWIGTLDVEQPPAAAAPMSLLTAWAPYMLVAILLVASRLKPLGLAGYLTACAIPIQDIFGTGIGHSVKPLYLPGTILILVSLMTYPLHRMNWRSYRRAWAHSTKTLLKASIALMFTVPMVQVFINSGDGAAGYHEMPVALAVGVEQLTGEFWPLFSPAIGGIGAAVAGSNTISNMMFSLFQFQVGERIGVDPIWIVALQAVGGAAGNTICVHNVVAALAVVGLVGREGAILRKTLIVFAYYAALSGALGYAVVWNSTKGLLNIGTIVVLGIVCLAIVMIATRKPPLNPEP